MVGIKLNHVVSGLLNGMLMHVFCCACSIIIFHTHDPSYISAGVLMHAFSAMIATMVYVRYSQAPGACIAGPDVNPALFFSMIIGDISANIEDQDNLRPTFLFTMSIGGLTVGITYFLLGRLHLTKVVQYVPVSLLNGFLSCVGFKIVSASLEIACGSEFYQNPFSMVFWKLNLFSFFIGIGMFISKHYHIPHHSLVVSAIIVLPLIVFYVLVFASVNSIDDMRCLKEDFMNTSCSSWMYAKFDHTTFVDLHTSLDFNSVEISAAALSTKHFPSMIIILIVDYLLELNATKKYTSRAFNFDREVETAGLGCILTGFSLIGLPVFSQKKFMKLNLALCKDKDSKVPHIICGTLNALLFFSGAAAQIINFVPRFVFGGLLLYVGLGYLNDNLFQSRSRVSREEYISIWGTVCVYFSLGLIWALVASTLAAAVLFAYSYGRVGVIKAIIPGGDFESRVVRSVTNRSQLLHLSNRYCIVQMQNFIFFGSAGQFLDIARNVVANQSNLPKNRRICYIIFDWTNVYGIDFSGLDVFFEIAAYLKSSNIMIVFTGVQEQIVKTMLGEHLLENITALFDNLDFGVEWVEEQLLEWAHLVRSRWLEFSPVVKLHETAKSKHRNDALGTILSDIRMGHELWKYVERKGFEKGMVLSEPRTPTSSMYIVERGKFSSLFTDTRGNVRKVRSYTAGSFIHPDALFSPSPAMYKIVSDAPVSIVLAISPHAKDALSVERPDVLVELQKTVLSYYRDCNMKLEREIAGLEHTRQEEREYLATRFKKQEAAGNRWKKIQRITRCSDASLQDGMKYEGDLNTDVASSLAFAFLAIVPQAMGVFEEYLTAGLSHRQLTQHPDGKSQAVNVVNNLYDFTEPEDSPHNQASVLKLSATTQKECEDAFNAHDVSKRGYVLTTEVEKLLGDIGLYVTKVELTLLLDLAVNRRAQGVMDSTVARSEVTKLLKDCTLESYRRPSIPREKEIEIKVLFLTQADLLSQLDFQTVNKIAQTTELLVFYEGETIVLKDSALNSMFFVIEGKLDVDDGRFEESVNASGKSVAFGDERFFLPIGHVEAKHTHTVKVVSKRAIVMEVFKGAVFRILPEAHPRFKELQTKAVSVAAKSKKRRSRSAQGVSNHVRQLNSVLSTQQRAPFGVRYRAITKVDLFEFMAISDQFLLSRVASEAEVLIFDEHDFIFHEGGASDFMLVVVSGDVKIANGNGEHEVIRFDKSDGGYVLGERGFYEMEGYQHPADVICASDILVSLKLSHSTLQNIFEESHEIWKEFDRQKNGKKQNKEQTKGFGMVTELITNITPSSTKLAGFTKGLRAVVPINVIQEEKELVLNEANEFGQHNATDIEGGPETMTDHNLEDIPDFLKLTKEQFMNIVSRIEFPNLGEQECGLIKSLFEAHMNSQSEIRHSQLVDIFGKSSYKPKLGAIGVLLAEWSEKGDKSLSLRAFTSIIAKALKTHKNLAEAELVYSNIVNSEKSPSKKSLGRKQTTAEVSTLSAFAIRKWDHLAKRSIGIRAEDIQRYWKNVLQCKISLDACEEMVLEADIENKGFVTFRDWLRALNRVHGCEIEQGATFEVENNTMDAKLRALRLENSQHQGIKVAKLLAQVRSKIVRAGTVERHMGGTGTPLNHLEDIVDKPLEERILEHPVHEASEMNILK